jgi:pectate lyase
MKDKLRLTCHLLFLFPVLIGCRPDNDDVHLARRFEMALVQFAETVLESGKDRYGEECTPLFVDGLHVTSLEPARWLGMDNQSWIVSNFASQQSLMRFLDGMTVLTGEEKYRKAAEEAAGYMLKNARSPNGLLYWGGHAAWDLGNNRPVGFTHEMKNQQPYYELMWRVNPDATHHLLKTIWGGHIVDWELLDFNRHAAFNRDAGPIWSSVYNDVIEIPFETNGSNLSFANASLSLIHAGATLAGLYENADALNWTERLVYRWQQAKHPDTGLSGGQTSYRGKKDRAWIAFGHVHPHINEATMIATYHRTSRYHTMPLVQMQNGLNLLKYDGPFSDTGNRFIDWALDDLRIYGELAYDPEKKVFESLLTDGSKLKWQDVRGGGSDYYLINTELGPISPNGEIFWSYAMAYRLSKDPFHWNMAREMALAMNLGDIGNIEGKRISVGSDGLLNRTVEAHLNNSDDWRTMIYNIYAFLDLYEATEKKVFLRAASNIGIALVDKQAENGLFPRTEREYARTSDEVSLAIMHLVGALYEKRDLLPKPMKDATFFHMEFFGELDKRQQRIAEKGDRRTMDHLVFYGQ